MFSEHHINFTRQRFRQQFPQADYLFRVAAEEVLEFIATLPTPPKQVLILGEFPLLRELAALYPQTTIQNESGFSHIPYIPPQRLYDFIVSLGQLHWSKDPELYLQTLKNHLSPCGHLWVTFVGEDSFCELRGALIHADIRHYGGAYPRVIPMIGAADSLQLIRSVGILNPIVNRQRLSLRHSSLIDLIRDLRYMGGTNALKERAQHITSRHIFHEAEIHLKKGGGVIETSIDLITLSSITF